MPPASKREAADGCAGRRFPSRSQPHGDDLTAPECLRSADAPPGTHPQQTSAADNAALLGGRAALDMNCSAMLSIQQLHPQLATAAYQYFLEGKKLLSVKDTAEILVCFPDVGLTEAAVKPQ